MAFITLTKNELFWNAELNAPDHKDEQIMVNVDHIRFFKPSTDKDTGLNDGTILIFSRGDEDGPDILKVEESPNLVADRINKKG